MLATDTSSVSVADTASGLAHPRRDAGLHFFNPAAVPPLVEVVRGVQTGDATLATALAVGKKLKKSCVLVKETPAFVVNRLLTRFLGEIIAAVDEGTPVEGAERAPGPSACRCPRSCCSSWSTRPSRRTWRRRLRLGNPGRGGPSGRPGLTCHLSWMTLCMPMIACGMPVMSSAMKQSST